ncbi:MAG: hypothetical protein JWP88_2324 [Flaviaesturariibacter sp.]|nr:hypothetical protein [Flaviaesturariibacter sp.]
MFDLKQVARELEKQRCAVHRQQPKVKVVDDKIDIASCCNAFQQKLIVQMQDGINNQLDNITD